MPANKPLDESLALPTAFIPGKVGVVTVLFNSVSVLQDFFASLDTQIYRNFIVYCVDNASHDGSAAMCSGHGNQFVTIVNAQNLGVAAGNNQGIRAAIADGCEYVLLLNNDVVFGPELFQQLLDGLILHHADMTTPLSYYYEPNNMVWCAGGGFNALAGNRQIHYGANEVDDKQFDNDMPVEYSPTCCVLIKRSLFERIGIMDERYFVYWDDTDWMLRAKRAGASLWFLHNAKLWHKVHSLTGKGSDFMIRYTRRNHAYFFYKHMSWLRASIYSLVYCSYYRVLLLSTKHRDTARLSLRSWKDGRELYQARMAEFQQRATHG